MFKMLSRTFMKANHRYNQIKYLNRLKYVQNIHLRTAQTLPIKHADETNRSHLNELIEKHENNVLYNSVIDQLRLKLGFRRNKSVEEKLSKKQFTVSFEQQKIQPLPISLKYLNEEIPEEKVVEIKDETVAEDVITQFPFVNVDEVGKGTERKRETIDTTNTIAQEISLRQVQLEQEKHANWMTDYENFDDTELSDLENWQLQYGTPDPISVVSNVPCGGCGALLHCKDTAIPGYIPSEIYKNHKYCEGQHLHSIICQRCHFLKYYNMALQVRVSPDEYPKILVKINENPDGMVILMVDLLDLPCSIWPNIINIIGNKKPIIIVGNKVDLLPADSKGYLLNVKNVLAENVQKYGFSEANIKHVALISAKTGYGIEELITKLHNLWENKGDVFLVGCTNVGKSSLFNALLQSDYCKVQAVDLIQRATTSLWPGTTLNLLKFPILKPSGWRLFVRTKRLMSLNKIRAQEERLRRMQLRKTNDPKYATLIGHIEKTFSAEEPMVESKDMFSIRGHGNATGKTQMGIDETSAEYALSRWCYDTPGVVQPDQLLHLLTTEELVLTLPKQMIRPQTYSVRPGNSIFIAGLARLDYLDGPETCRFTIFTSEHLPITICDTTKAEQLYEDLLGTKLFKVPLGTEDRLSKWPKLECGEKIHLKGVDWEKSCADIVLSSAGWVAVTCGPNLSCVMNAWTPEKRGIYVRGPILPKAVCLRGDKIRHSPAYKKSRVFIR